ncbi:hypothetical protein CFE70_005356 [Pyrenophora teres f. teres 0-1]
MAKRKPERDPEELPDASDKRKQQDDDDSGSDEDMDMVNVDFEWFDPQPAVDFHGLKNLLRQLLDVDSQLFNLSELADIILSQPLLGSTVKVDGNETDPYAFLTVLNLETHKIGLILTERFINMPHEIVPPMYTMLLEEIQWAVEEKEPYTFTHYLVLSKCYSEIQSQLPSHDAAQPSKKRSKKAEGGEETFYFHPEDEVLHKHAVGYTSFEYDTPVDEGASDSKRAFQELGVRPKGHMVLIEAERFAGAVEAVKGFLSGQ